MRVVAWREIVFVSGLAKRFVSVPFFKFKRSQKYGWPNSVNVISGRFIQVYEPRISDLGDSKGFGSLVGEALDHAAAGEGAGGDGSDDDLAQ
jgi:hypothetical protein